MDFSLESTPIKRNEAGSGNKPFETEQPIYPWENRINGLAHAYPVDLATEIIYPD
jgi:hypothetical protein